MRPFALLGFAAALALSGCGLFPSAADRAMQKTPDFRAGYGDGCAAASTTGANPREGPYRDESLYSTSKAYRTGWGNGFAVCRNQGAAGAAPTVNGPLNPIPGSH
jgi:hypothetical protein